ncbi:MAG: hypothetical protein IJP82_08155 [Bacteroidaceae bacterium]|nr:hypothetical protein [Bacteroidaceae bacterium]
MKNIIRWQGETAIEVKKCSSWHEYCIANHWCHPKRAFVGDINGMPLEAPFYCHEEDLF